jgi:hypothetical protein
MRPAVENNYIGSRIEDGSEALEVLWSLPLLKAIPGSHLGIKFADVDEQANNRSRNFLRGKVGSE